MEGKQIENVKISIFLQVNPRPAGRVFCSIVRHCQETGSKENLGPRYPAGGRVSRRVESSIEDSFTQFSHHYSLGLSLSLSRSCVTADNWTCPLILASRTKSVPRREVRVRIVDGSVTRRSCPGPFRSISWILAAIPRGRLTIRQ